MSEIFDYLKWRGDLSFSKVALCEVDSVIFSMLAYVDLAELCASGEVTVAEGAKRFCREERELGLIMPTKQIRRMLFEMAKTRRFGKIVITDAVSRISEREGYQFAAASFLLTGKSLLISFMGTDDSIVGWREDCCLAFLDEIPAQRMATEYLLAVAEKYPDRQIYLTGHSKGGNLAIYSAVKCADRLSDRIAGVYCNDGPGLSRKMIESEEYAVLQPKLHVLLPKSSFIGIMFEKGEKFSVVDCPKGGLYQHDPFCWVLDGAKFKKLDSLSTKGLKNERVFRERMEKMSLDEKKELVEGVFEIIESTGAKTLTELTRQAPKRLVSLIKTYTELDKEKREMITLLLFRLLGLKKEKSE